MRCMIVISLQRSHFRDYFPLPASQNYSIYVQAINRADVLKSRCFMQGLQTSCNCNQIRRHSHFFLHGGVKCLHRIPTSFYRTNVLPISHLMQQPRSMQATAIFIYLEASILSNLNPCRSPGPDGLRPHLLRLPASLISQLLAILFELSVFTGIIPDGWRRAVVAHIHKKGARTNTANYCPINFTSIACKLLERVIRDGITLYLKWQQLLDKNKIGSLVTDLTSLTYSMR